MQLDAMREKTARFAIGLMSGSSCDGVDAVLVRMKGTGPDLHLKYIDFAMVPYADSLRNKLLSTHFSARDVAVLNFELGEAFAEAARSMMEVAEKENVEVDFVASHGHTIAHVPPRGEGDVGTLQIGESAFIAERTGLMTISDFRTRDMAAGGQAAPLVPYADWLLFRREGRNDVCLNIG